jgi:hypothetical protein
VVKTSATSSFVTLASYFTSLGNNFLNFKMTMTSRSASGIVGKSEWTEIKKGLEWGFTQRNRSGNS